MEHSVIDDPTYGFKRLDPLPSDAEFEEFYQSRYYDLIRAGGRAPELRRLSKGGEEAERERAWLGATLYADVAHALARWAPEGLVLDVGCGTGELVAYLSDHGVRASGVEPSESAVGMASELGRAVEQGTVESWLARCAADGREAPAAAVLLNVLEHVPDPEGLLSAVVAGVARGGLVFVRVPNDFNPLQLQLVRDRGLPEWWVAVPDHVNYFDFASLRRLFEGVGLEVLWEMTDYPMELFALMGDDYLTDPSLGPECHARRVAMETAMPVETRRALYEAFASRSLGRNCLLVGRVTT